MPILTRGLQNPVVTLVPADEKNVECLIRWTLNPMAQGPYKQVPAMTIEELRALFLDNPNRQYFLITCSATGKWLGRFYYRAWHFGEDAHEIDWELNIFLADPLERGKGYGTATQRLAAEYLLAQPETRSVFAYTAIANTAEQRALQKTGFRALGPLPHAYYRVDSPPGYVLYSKSRRSMLPV